jgi:hypothetical protein
MLRWCSWRFSISVLLVYVIHEFRGLLRVLNQQVFLPVGLMGADAVGVPLGGSRFDSCPGDSQ